jgi:hypothetical protein
MAPRLLCSWWRADRIRVSPRAGELLRLEPPCCLHVSGQYAQILDRGTRVGGSTVIYRCGTRGEPGTLIVKFDSSTSMVAVEWRQGGQVTQLAAADVEVFR